MRLIIWRIENEEMNNRFIGNIFFASAFSVKLQLNNYFFSN